MRCDAVCAHDSDSNAVIHRCRVLSMRCSIRGDGRRDFTEAGRVWHAKGRNRHALSNSCGAGHDSSGRGRSYNRRFEAHDGFLVGLPHENGGDCSVPVGSAAFKVGRFCHLEKWKWKLLKWSILMPPRIEHWCKHARDSLPIFSCSACAPAALESIDFL